MTKTYFDTSVLIPLILADHENHQRANRLFSDALQTGTIVTSATHAYAEMYRTITKGRSSFRVSPSEAYDVIVEKLTPLMTMVELTKEDYEATIRRCVRLDLSSSIIYDALHVQAALKAEAEVLYTDNLRDFNRLVTEEDDIIIKGIR